MIDVKDIAPPLIAKNRRPIQSRRVGILWLWIVAILSGPAQAALEFPPSPYDILASTELDTPVLDATPFCVPEGVDAAVSPILREATAGEWSTAQDLLTEWVESLDQPPDALVLLGHVFESRQATGREDLLEVERRWRGILSAPPEQRFDPLCARLEYARVLILLDRMSEGAAQLTRAERLLEALSDPKRPLESVAFLRAEILYHRGQRFDAHLRYREIARNAEPRLALAARLRLTDLSFDAGKDDGVDIEYETLLPRASAFGASSTGWALRAAEAAIAAGDPGRGLRWIEHFLAEGPGRDARDAAGIRMADIDLAFDDVMGARKRLSTISGRRSGDAIGALAAIRAIDLGVAAGSPEQRLEILLRALRNQRGGVRRYALTVLMNDRADRKDYPGALAVATRLAYDGIDPVLSPDYNTTLDRLLTQVSAAAAGDARCSELVRALGGRYGILIERASRPDAFAELGLCFEEMELPWLAATVYRSISRRFGAGGAATVTLPLARASLAIGEVVLARRVALAALKDPEEPPEAWRAIVAEADFIEGRFEASAEGVRAIVDSPALRAERARLLHRLAETLEKRPSIQNARFVAERAPQWLAPEGGRPAERAVLIDSTLLAAHALRKGGALDESFDLYRVLDREAEAGSVRASARFWLGLAEQPGAEGESAWGEEPEISLGAPWARLAQFEQHFDVLRNAYSEKAP